MKNTDVLTQFMPMRVAFAADSSVLVSANYSTGLSIRHGLAWLVHAVHFSMGIVAATLADGAVVMVISTKKGLTTRPEIADAGVVALRRITLGSEPGVHDGFYHEAFMPPVPLVAGNLTLYAKADTDLACLAEQSVYARIAYTTMELDAKDYVEVAEVWAQAEG